MKIPNSPPPAFVILILLCFIQSSFGFDTVIIDAGHGGKDKGGSWGKVYEKHLALDTAFRLERYLKLKGYQVVMTRTEDRYLSLSERTRIANQFNNAIFVSIHINKAGRTGASGIETFFYSDAGRELGQAVQSRMIAQAQAVDRGNKRATYYVLKKSYNPAILAEIGFVSNAAERKKMKQGRYRDGVAKSIAEGIVAYDKRRR